MSHEVTDNIALIDLDGTVADCDGALQEQQALLRSPNEPPFQDRYSGGEEPEYIEARRKLIQRQPGFWRNLRPLTLGFQVVNQLRKLGFNLHVLTKGPKGNGAAWGGETFLVAGAHPRRPRHRRQRQEPCLREDFVRRFSRIL